MLSPIEKTDKKFIRGDMRTGHLEMNKDDSLPEGWKLIRSECEPGWAIEHYRQQEWIPVKVIESRAPKDLAPEILAFLNPKFDHDTIMF